MTRTSRPEGRPVKRVGTCSQITKDRERGSILRLTGDPETDASEILEHLGPDRAGHLAILVLRLVAEVTR